jgi:hypothetical protein
VSILYDPTPETLIDNFVVPGVIMIAGMIVLSVCDLFDSSSFGWFAPILKLASSSSYRASAYLFANPSVVFELILAYINIW